MGRSVLSVLFAGLAFFFIAFGFYAPFREAVTASLLFEEWVYTERPIEEVVGAAVPENGTSFAPKATKWRIADVDSANIALFELSQHIKAIGELPEGSVLRQADPSIYLLHRIAELEVRLDKLEKR